MEKISIKAQPRTTTGKGPARRMRVAGLVPANIIGNGEATSASVVEKEIQKLIDSGIRKATLIEIELGDKKENVFVKEIQRFPHTGQIRHIDFFKVTPGKKILTTVAVKTSGVAKGSKAGGQFEHLVHELRVKSTPEDLVDVITVDVTGLDVGMSIKVSELPTPKTWEIIINGDPIVTSCNKTKAILAAERAEKAEAEAGGKKPAAKKGKK
ncbi:MAG: 50S ribosomal protein L25/general stress protein Ctc [Leptospira sp.]|nr:50S ribosomal protein L25/general stress protein Ctc [Leptospira sp.]